MNVTVNGFMRHAETSEAHATLGEMATSDGRGVQMHAGVPFWNLPTRRCAFFSSIRSHLLNLEGREGESEQEKERDNSHV